MGTSDCSLFIQRNYYNKVDMGLLQFSQEKSKKSIGFIANDYHFLWLGKKIKKTRWFPSCKGAGHGSPCQFTDFSVFSGVLSSVIMKSSN